MSHHGTRFQVIETPTEFALSPITFIASAGAYVFQDYLTADQARDLASRLLAVAEQVEPAEVTG